MFAAGQFLLGTFASNCSSGMSVTKVGERWVNSWDNNLKLARQLDEAGIDFMQPIARWIGERNARRVDFRSWSLARD